jgi:hypothetical protein
MGPVLDLISGLLSCVPFTGEGWLMGYFFVRKRTEHEVGYWRRVETAERIQDSVASVTEELLAARKYVFGTGPFDGALAKRIGRTLGDLEGYYVRREIWLNRETLARLESLTAALSLRQREPASLPLSYEDPDFEREHERVGGELDRGLRTDLPAAREELADAFGGMLGVGRWCGFASRVSPASGLRTQGYAKPRGAFEHGFRGSPGRGSGPAGNGQKRGPVYLAGQLDAG